MTTATLTHRFLNVAGKKTQLTVGGEGPPLVYLHSAAGETEWMPFHEELAKHFTLYLPAHPGFALSEGLDEIQNVQDYAWHYVDLFQQLDLVNLPVVGFSLGAWIAAEMAILRPQLVRKMVMVAAAGLRVEGAPIAEIFVNDLEDLRDLLFFDANDPSIPLALPTSYEDERMLHWLRAREATARVGWNPYMHNPKLPQHLRRVACPVLLLWGRNDRLIPAAHGEFYAQHLPNARLKIFGDCGHMLPFEKEEEFVKTVRAFVG